MKSDQEIYIQSEFAATQQMLITTMTAVVHLTKAVAQMERQELLQPLMEGGLKSLDLVDFWDVPEEQKELVREKAKARYSAFFEALMPDRGRPA